MSLTVISTHVLNVEIVVGVNQYNRRVLSCEELMFQPLDQMPPPRSVPVPSPLARLSALTPACEHQHAGDCIKADKRVLK